MFFEGLNMGIEQEVIIITGTRKGIPRDLTEYYLKKGHIVIGCSREESDWKSCFYEHFCIDVGDEPAVQKMVNEVYRKFKKNRCLSE